MSRSQRWLSADKAFPSPGKGTCRVCGKTLDCRTRTTCSQECRKRIRLSISTTSQRWHVEARDKGICAQCGCDTYKLERVMREYATNSCLRQKMNDAVYGYRPGSQTIYDMLGIPRGRRSGRWWDMAHVVAIADGGGIRPGMTSEEIMGNLKTLCLWCHREETRAQRRIIQ